MSVHGHYCRRCGSGYLCDNSNDSMCHIMALIVEMGCTVAKGKRGRKTGSCTFGEAVSAHLKLREQGTPTAPETLRGYAALDALKRAGYPLVYDAQPTPSPAKVSHPSEGEQEQAEKG